jgi:hypothetical protein
MKSLSKNRFQVQVDDDQIFLKLFSTRDKVSILIKDQTVAIKDEFILRANEIVVRDNNSIVRGASREHPLTPVAFSRVIRRRGNIDDDFGSAR